MTLKLLRSLDKDLSEAANYEATTIRAQTTAGGMTEAQLRAVERRYERNPQLPADAQVAAAVSPEMTDDMFDQMAMQYEAGGFEPLWGDRLTGNQLRYLYATPEEQVQLDSVLNSLVRMRQPESLAERIINSGVPDRVSQVSGQIGRGFDRLAEVDSSGTVGTLGQGLSAGRSAVGAIDDIAGAVNNTPVGATARGFTRNVMPGLDINNQLIQGAYRTGITGVADVAQGDLMGGLESVAELGRGLQMAPGEVMAQTDYAQTVLYRTEQARGALNAVLGREYEINNDIGNGFFAADDSTIVQRRRAAERTMGTLPNGQTITIGRATASGFGFDPDGTAFNVMSGLLDAAVTLGAPGVEGGLARGLNSGRRSVQAGLGGLADDALLSGLNRTVDPQAARAWLNSGESENLINYLARTEGEQGFVDVWNASRGSLDPDAVRKIVDADTPEDVRFALEQAILNGNMPAFRNQAGRAITRATGALGDLDVLRASGLRRLRGLVPENVVHLQDGHRSVEFTFDYARNVKADNETIARWVNQMGRASNEFERYEALTSMLSETAVRLSDGGIPAERARALTRMFNAEDELARTSLDDMLLGDPDWSSYMMGDNDLRLPAMHLMSQAATTLQVPDFRDLRRATSWARPLWEMSADPSAAARFTRALGQGWQGMFDGLMMYQTRWKQARLLRLGYPLRTWMTEEPLRKLVDGRTGFSHPGGVFAAMLERNIRTGDDLDNMLRQVRQIPGLEDLDDAAAFDQAVIRNIRPSQGVRDAVTGEVLEAVDGVKIDERLGGLVNEAATGTRRGQYIRYIRGENDVMYRQAWRDELMTLGADEVGQMVARHGADEAYRRLVGDSLVLELDEVNALAARVEVEGVDEVLESMVGRRPNEYRPGSGAQPQRPLTGPQAEFTSSDAEDFWEPLIQGYSEAADRSLRGWFDMKGDNPWPYTYLDEAQSPQRLEALHAALRERFGDTVIVRRGGLMGRTTEAPTEGLTNASILPDWMMQRGEFNNPPLEFNRWVNSDTWPSGYQLSEISEFVRDAHPGYVGDFARKVAFEVEESGLREATPDLVQRVVSDLGRKAEPGSEEGLLRFTQRVIDDYLEFEAGLRASAEDVAHWTAEVPVESIRALGSAEEGEVFVQIPRGADPRPEAVQMWHRLAEGDPTLGSEDGLRGYLQRLAQEGAKPSGPRSPTTTQWARLQSFNSTLADPLALDDYLKMVANKVDALTGGSDELLSVVRQGRWDDAIDLAELSARGVGPQAVAGRAVLESDQIKSLDRAVNTFFDVMVTRPTNELLRVPTFQQSYERILVELAPLMSDSDEAIRMARRANVTAESLATIEATAKGEGLLDLQRIDALAKAGALDDVRRLHFDATRQTQFFDTMRLMAPFGEAWREVVVSWSKLIASDPFTPTRFAGQTARALDSKDFGNTYFNMVGVDDKEDQGFFYTNEYGEKVFYYPGSRQFMQWFTSRASVDAGPMNLPVPWQSNGTEGVPVDLEGSLAGLNIAGEVLPGLGPVSGITADYILPKGTSWDGYREALFPYGSPPSLLNADNFLPAWMATMLRGDGEMNQDEARVYGNTRLRVMRYLYSTGDYMDGQEGFNRLLADSDKITPLTFVARGAAQFTAPSSPQLSHNMIDADGSLADMSVLVDAYRRLQEEDPSMALERFLAEYGEGALLATQGGTTARYPGGTPLEGASYDWVRDNPSVETEHRELHGFFAPLGEGSDFSQEAYLRSLERGDRIVLTAEEQLMLANHRRGSLEYRRFADAVPASERSEEQRLFLNNLRLELMEKYPGYDNVDGIAGRAPAFQLIDRGLVDQALEDPVLLQTNAGQALAEYWRFRESVLAQAEANGVTVGGRQGWRTTNEGEPYREALRTAGNELVRQEPEFARMWDLFLSQEFAREDEE